MEGTPQPHLVLVPWLGSVSHIIPMADIGCLLASHGAPVTIVTTPANAPLVRARVDDGSATPHADGGAAIITVTAIPFPAAEAGLPEGCERLDLLRSPADVPRFFQASKQFGESVARHCRSLRRPSCGIVAGMCHSWALGLARGLGVPCYIFHGFGAFALLCIEHLFRHGAAATTADDELFGIPVLPSFECRVSRRQLPPHFLLSSAATGGGQLLREMREFDVAVDGVVVNTFEELEHGSAALLAAATGKEVLAVGPVSLSHPPSPPNNPQVAIVSSDDDARRCMAWLDTKAARSVVYVSFGSAGRLPPAQLIQLGMALVSCPWPVLWVVGGADSSLPDDAEKWMRENTDGDGLADSQCLSVRGWAPQVAILAHPAVGGFLTHCGWGSTLEAIAAGVPMATWPMFAEQFINERLIVDLLGVGVSVGVTKPTENVLTATKPDGSSEEAEVEVGMEQVKMALEKLMDPGAEGKERRRRCQELKAKAEGALEKGGSSYLNLDKLANRAFGLKIQ